MQPFSLKSNTIGIIIATLLSIRGRRKKSLSPTGAVTAWMVGYLSIACGNRGFLLLLFYQLGTMATKYKKELKVKKDGDASKSSVRSPYQVLACSGIAVVISLVHVCSYGEEKAIDFNASPMESALACAIIAHYCTCCGDTFASEIGILSKSKPFLVTSPWRTVPHGTNGGISFFGTVWSGIGGLFIGLFTLFLDVVCSGMNYNNTAIMSNGWMNVFHIPLIEMALYSTLCGLLGSFLDSILGATLQATYYDEDEKLVFCEKEDAPANVKHICGVNLLSNAQVNLFSVLATTLIGGFVLAPIVFQ